MPQSRQVSILSTKVATGTSCATLNRSWCAGTGVSLSPRGPPRRAGSISASLEIDKGDEGEDNRTGQSRLSPDASGAGSDISRPSRREEWRVGGQALGRLVPLSSSTHVPYTRGLSTWWSTRALTRSPRGTPYLGVGFALSSFQP